MRRRRLILPAAIVTATAAMAVVYTNSTPATPRGPGPIYPTGWSHSTAQSDGPLSFWLHVPGWDYDLGEWNTTIWHTTLVRDADGNGDGIVDITDVRLFLNLLDDTGGPDINKDGVCGPFDLLAILDAMEPPLPEPFIDQNNDGLFDMTDLLILVNMENP